MQKLKLLLLTLFLAFGLFSCEENPAPIVDSANDLMVITDANSFASADLGIITDATLEKDMTYSPLNESVLTPTNVRVPLEGILKQLRLTNDQVVLIRGFAKDYFDCVKRVSAALREAEARILARVKAARAEVYKDLRDGTITREEAARRLTNINKTAREAFANLEIRETTKAALKDCLESYIAKIRRVLTDAQLERFNELLRRLAASNTGTRG